MCQVFVENLTCSTSQSLKAISEWLVFNREVGLAYMKSYELEEMIFEKGRKEGREEGREKGREDGKIEGTIMLCKRLGKCKDETIKLLCEELQLTEAKANKAYDKYAK